MTDRECFIASITRALNELPYPQLKVLAVNAEAVTDNYDRVQQLVKAGWIAEVNHGAIVWTSPAGECYPLEAAYAYQFTNKYQAELLNSEWVARPGPYQTRGSKEHYSGDCYARRTWYVAGLGNELICEGCDEYTARRIVVDHNSKLAVLKLNDKAGK